MSKIRVLFTVIISLVLFTILSLINPASTAAQSADAQAVIDLTNNLRRSLGMTNTCLRTSAELTQAAQGHAQYMYNTGNLSHTGSGGSTHIQRAQAAGYNSTYVGENIAAGYTTPQSVFNGWVGSSGHYANLINANYREIGVARVGNYWVMMLGRRNGVSAIPCVKTTHAATGLGSSGYASAPFRPTFSWTHDSSETNEYAPATYYNLYVARADTGAIVVNTWFTLAEACGGGSSCSVTPDVIYYNGTHNWWVQSYSPTGGSTWTGQQTFNLNAPQTGVITKVAPAAASGIVNNQVSFQWQAQTNAVYYRLYVAGPNNSVIDEWHQASAICSAGTCTVPTKTLANGRYTWYVAGWNPAQLGPWTSGTSFWSGRRPPAMIVQSAPTVGQSFSAGQVGFQWMRDADAESYRLYVTGPNSSIIDEWHTAGAVCGASTCSLPARTLPNGTYTWYVAGYNAANGYGEWTAARTFTVTVPAPGTIALNAPAASATVTTSGTGFSWSADPNADWYHLYISGPGGMIVDEWHQADDVCTSTCSLPSRSLANGSYTWYMQGYSIAAGEGPWSTGRAFTVAVPVPGIINRTLPTADQVITNNQVAFQWQADPNADYYRIYVSGAGQIIDEWHEAAAVCSSGTCGVPARTLPTGDYVWYMQAYSLASGEGPWTGARNFRSGPPAPGTITQTAPSGSVSQSMVAFQWQADTNATQYHFYLGNGTAAVADEMHTAASICSAGVCSLPARPVANGSYIWYVRGIGSGGEGPWGSGTPFSISLPAPGTVTMTSPGAGATIAPGSVAFNWTAPANSAYYRLIVAGATGVVYDTWLDGTGICANYTTCSQTVSLPAGAYHWNIQAWGAGGVGPFNSQNTVFTVGP